MKFNKFIFPAFAGILVISLLVIVSCLNKNQKTTETEEFSGSESCRECHERFYKLWSPSHHGLAMQPITSDFIADKVHTNQDEIFMEEAYYKAIAIDTMLFIQERKNDSIKNHEVLWALGGKNVYYFLTPWEGGRLQTLPLAFNVNTNEWYNNPESAIRHFPNSDQEDEALSWTDLQYTFNTSCYGCHVSQLSNNFDLTKNTYDTHWGEPGINCETCHGPSSEHVRIFKNLKEGEEIPEDIGLIVTKTFTAEQHNSSCAPCHAKMTPITASYMPGDKYFDNYDLTTIENTDFYADGRDLGENYTITSWKMSECAIAGELHCVTCHTSSGRYRFKSDVNVEANKACASCHQKKAEHVDKHSHHPLVEHSPQCIDCHMPHDMFGHMERSDHSMRPPMPSATIKFGSPNACNMCHEDKTPEWADKHVRSWHKDDYQAETLYVGELIDDARNSKWDRVDEIFKAILNDKYGEVFTNSFIRLLINYTEDDKIPVLIAATDNASPLVRSSAANGMLGNRSEEVKNTLLKVANDSIRLVRLASAASLSVFPREEFNSTQIILVDKVNKEYEESLVTRPDSWSAHYNLGNHYQNMGHPDKALTSYETSLKVYPEAFMPLVNSSFLYSINGNIAKAEEYLKRALEVEPENEAANLNYALLMAEMNKMSEAEKAFRIVLTHNENNTTALYNLSIIISKWNLNEACELSGRAMKTDSSDPKFAYTHAFFLNQNKQTVKAISILNKIVENTPSHLNSVFLLGNIYLQSGNKGKTIGIYEKALKAVGNNQQAAMQLQQAIQQVKGM